mmetsp:Transcript_26615/g.77395  ORF Transcript_26615/g.77395 Transcript_26615/m.77395 type:complete len:277 (+) Transcript_26615:315-1145(+)
MWVSMCFPRAVDSYFIDIVKKRPYSLAKIATRGVRPGYGSAQTRAPARAARLVAHHVSTHRTATGDCQCHRSPWTYGRGERLCERGPEAQSKPKPPSRGRTGRCPQTAPPERTSRAIDGPALGRVRLRSHLAGQIVVIDGPVVGRRVSLPQILTRRLRRVDGLPPRVVEERAELSGALLQQPPFCAQRLGRKGEGVAHERRPHLRLVLHDRRCAIPVEEVAVGRGGQLRRGGVAAHVLAAKPVPEARLVRRLPLGVGGSKAGAAQPVVDHVPELVM